jgi:hypothetical protein
VTEGRGAGDEPVAAPATTDAAEAPDAPVAAGDPATTGAAGAPDAPVAVDAPATTEADGAPDAAAPVETEAAPLPQVWPGPPVWPGSSATPTSAASTASPTSPASLETPPVPVSPASPPMAPLLPPPPPSLAPSPGPRRFDGTDGPLLPPPPPGIAAALARQPVTDAVLAIPLGPRRLVGQALDLLTRPDAGLRSASFYIGFLLLVTVGPAIALLGIAFVVLPDPFGRPVPGDSESVRQTAWAAWLILAAIPAYLGYIGAAIEARALAVAVIGGRAEGRPLRLRESIAIARRRFWSVLAAQLLVGIVTTLVRFAVEWAVGTVVRDEAALSFGIGLAVSLVVGAPFVYLPAGIVLGEAPALEAIRRSIRLARTRKQLAIVVTLFTLFSQILVQLGLSAGADVYLRLGVGSGLLDAFPVWLVVPVVAALVFAFGTLQFLVEAIAAAPAVHAFEALTHYTAGLEIGRRTPLGIRHWWDPWFTPGLAVCAAVALTALVFGVLTLRF